MWHKADYGYPKPNAFNTATFNMWSKIHQPALTLTRVGYEKHPKDAFINSLPLTMTLKENLLLAPHRSTCLQPIPRSNRCTMSPFDPTRYHSLKWRASYFGFYSNPLPTKMGVLSEEASVKPEDVKVPILAAAACEALPTAASPRTLTSTA